MSVHLQRQIEKVRKLVVSLGEEVMASVQHAATAVETRDAALARRVIENDTVVDQMELDVEEECLHTLAVYQPVAMDLRYVVAVLKMNNDLERIADGAANICEQVLLLSREEPVDPREFLDGMADKVQLMLREALSALMLVDVAKAQWVITADDQVDAIHRRMYELVESAMRDQPHHIPQLMHLTNISRQFERIADLATNVAEDVIYMARGEIRRHQHHLHSRRGAEADQPGRAN